MEQIEETLADAVDQLSRARQLQRVMKIVRRYARDLTGADGVTFVLRDGDLCHYAEENAISPLWKGKRFPIGKCVSGWAMLNATTVAISDVFSDPRVPHAAYRPTFVKSLAVVPVRDRDPMAAIGAYWADHHEATEHELRVLKVLADASALALSRTA